MSHFFAYLSRMKHIQRWGLMRNTMPENIQGHSLEVATIAHCLALVKNRLFNGKVDPQKVAVLAMFHEISEVITGDLATPIKYYNPEIKDAYHTIEGIAKKRLYGMLPHELQPAYQDLLFDSNADEVQNQHHQLVKAADKIAAYLKCLEELKSGNQEFAKAEKTIKAQIDDFALPEVAYFMETFIPSFRLTLDELD